MTIKEMIDLPPVWLALFAALVWLQASMLPLGGFGSIGGPLGAVLILAGIALMGAAFIEFRRHDTTVIPHHDASALITSGIYRHSRNPIYLADALILAGLAFRWDAVIGLGLVPVFMWVIQRRFIIPEEARLRSGFGADFESWAARTGRWF